MSTLKPLFLLGLCGLPCSLVLLADDVVPAYYDAANAPGAGNFNTTWPGFRAHWLSRRKTFAAERPVSPGATVFLGDSITEGCPTTKLFPGVRSVNRGIAGETTRGMLWRLEADVIALRPAAVVILGGTNDLFQPGGSPEATATNLRVMVERLRAALPGCRVIVPKVMPNAKVEPERVRAFNDAVDKALEPHGDCVRVDTFTPYLTPAGGFDASAFRDGVHPNAEGYARYQKAMSRALSTPSAPTAVPPLSDGVISFEAAAVPEGVSASGGGLSVSTRRRIHGERSLRWAWKGGDVLVIRHPVEVLGPKAAREAFGTAALSSFHLFVHNERAVADGKLRVEFATGGADAPTQCHFEMGLDFTGWRKATPAFLRDMKGTPGEGMDTIRLVAPAGAGVMHLDQIIPGIVNDPRFQWPDRQLPEIGPDNAPPARLPVPARRPIEADARELADLLVVAARLAGEAPRRSAGEVDAACARAEALGVVEDGDGVRGPHVITTYEHDMFPPELRRKVVAGQAGYMPINRYGQVMLDVAEAWRAAPDEQSRGRAQALFMRLTRHLLDQGWADGSALGTTHHFGYQSREWVRAVFLMREPLAKAGLLAPMSGALEWYAREFILLDSPGESLRRGVDMDYLNTVAASHLMLCLMHPDPAVRASRARAAADYWRVSLGETGRDLGSGFKPDGTAFHHWGHYPGYAYPGVIGGAYLAWVLRGTRFALPESALAPMKGLVRTAAFSGNPQTGMALAGRHPFGESSVESLAEAAVRLVEASPAPDRDFAALAVSLSPGDAGRVAAACGGPVGPAAPAQGHRVFNYGCFAIHRHGDRMVTLKGFNRYVWSSEIYAKDNRYGRYPSNGSVQIVKRGANADSGYLQEGWDWSRFPGATARRLPPDLLESPSRHTLMLRSDKTFCGGSSLESRYGVFVMQLWEPDMKRFDPAFAGLKTVFCFDDRIVCLGSGIRSGDSEHPVETTLFQHADTPGASGVQIGPDGPVGEFPFARRLPPPVWLTDGRGNGYVVRSGPDIVCERRRQVSRHNKTKARTEGDFASAVLDHGVAPSDGGYEYAVLPGATPERTAAFARNPPYAVLSRDGALHAVHDQASGVRAYVAFRQGGFAAGDLLAVSSPCLVMTRETPEGLRVSVGDPDLNIPKDGVSAPKTLAVTLRGERRLAAPAEGVSASAVAGATQVVVRVRDGIPVEFTLR